MTQEEFYVWLFVRGNRAGKLPEFNPEFLKNYEITKLFLEKFGINCLSENQQRNLNLEAVSAWFRVSKFIHLKYNIPEILELLPEKIRKDLVLESSEIKFLPKLKSVGEWMVVGRVKSNYWKNYFNESGRTDLAERVTTV